MMKSKVAGIALIIGSLYYVVACLCFSCHFRAGDSKSEFPFVLADEFRFHIGRFGFDIWIFLQIQGFHR